MLIAKLRFISETYSVAPAAARLHGLPKGTDEFERALANPTESSAYLQLRQGGIVADNRNRR
jgi:hypothetical protein